MIQDKFTVDALVITEQQIGESDKLITLLTRHNGVIKAYASGARTIKSKKGAATSLLAYSSFTLSIKGNTYKVIEASPIDIFLLKPCRLLSIFVNYVYTTHQTLRIVNLSFV